MNTTGDLGSDVGRVATCSAELLRHFQRGVVKASSNELPMTTREEPRNFRLEAFIAGDDREVADPSEVNPHY